VYALLIAGAERVFLRKERDVVERILVEESA
jgi:hypothetical protein